MSLDRHCPGAAPPDPGGDLDQPCAGIQPQISAARGKGPTVQHRDGGLGCDRLDRDQGGREAVALRCHELVPGPVELALQRHHLALPTVRGLRQPVALRPHPLQLGAQRIALAPRGEQGVGEASDLLLTGA